jgi:hypothetical protein
MCVDDWLMIYKVSVYGGVALPVATVLVRRAPSTYGATVPKF